jgi:hypothetical protein
MKARTVSAGEDRSFFVDASGGLQVCGTEAQGKQGLLGLREGTSQASFTVVVPMPVPSLAGMRALALALGLLLAIGMATSL